MAWVPVCALGVCVCVGGGGGEGEVVGRWWRGVPMYSQSRIIPDTLSHTLARTWMFCATLKTKLLKKVDRY